MTAKENTERSKDMISNHDNSGTVSDKELFAVGEGVLVGGVV